jgi:hypothetical protein
MKYLYRLTSLCTTLNGSMKIKKNIIIVNFINHILQSYIWVLRIRNMHLHECKHVRTHTSSTALNTTGFTNCSRGDSRAVFVVWPAGRPARPRTQHDSHHDTKVKPEAATANTELLMMGLKTPETCWAVSKRQDNVLRNCCIRLVIYLNCAMMHGLTNLKFYI